MRALLDVNVLIALLDSGHVSHAAAWNWFAMHAGAGWASCPITQNGCIRIMSNPSYPNTVPAHAVIERLGHACADQVHEFWTDGISLLDPDIVDATRIHGPRQLTDLYLLALAVERGGRFVTFDAGVPLSAVRKARPERLIVL